MTTNSTNRFEQVDERQDDAITLLLSKTEEGARGALICPAVISNGRLAEDQVGPLMSSQDAFRAGVRLANEIKAPLVVVDPEMLWDPAWGVLYRDA